MLDRSAYVCESTSAIGELYREWDELAVAASRPYAAPAWALSWWEEMRPSRTRLAVAVARDRDGKLIGVAPLFARGRIWRPLGDRVAASEPLAEKGSESEAAAALATAIHESERAPAMVRIEAHASSPKMAAGMAAVWRDGRGAWRRTGSIAPVPGIRLDEGFDAWWAQRSSSFRREISKKQRKLEAMNGAFRYATAETLEADVGDLMCLHTARLASRGGTSLTSAGVQRMLVAVGRELLSVGRFRLLCLEVEGQTIAAQLLLAAGAEVSGWNTGFDHRHAKLSPMMLCMVRSVADAAERGEKTMTFGPGGQSYKYRMSNWEDSLVSHLIAPPGSLYPIVRMRVAADHAYAGARRRVATLVRR